MGMGFPWFLRSGPTVLRSGTASRVVFYYPGEDGTYLDGAFVTVFASGVVDIIHPKEHVTTHIQNVEIIWKNARTLPGERTFVLHSFEHARQSPRTEVPTQEE